MTDHEKREQQKEIMMRAYEVQRELEALKIKAERIGAVLADVAEVMKTNPLLLLSGSWRERSAKELAANPAFYNDSIFRDALDYDQLVTLAKEYERTKAQMDELQSQKQRLGI